MGQGFPSRPSITFCTSAWTGGTSPGLPATSMREAGLSTKLSSGKTERMASIASAAVRLSIRKSLPVTVWRATESAGKLVSQMTRSSPCPMARRQRITSALRRLSKLRSMKVLPGNSG
jgi:hypothetical protein